MSNGKIEISPTVLLRDHDELSRACTPGVADTVEKIADDLSAANELTGRGNVMVVSDGSAVHRLMYRRTNHANGHVRGYEEEGTTTTPFDPTMLNDLDRFHLVMDVIDRVPGPGAPGRRGCGSR